MQVIERKDTQNDMAVCAGVLKTSPEPYLMIEWLELLRLTGVSMVSFYTMGDLIKNTPGEKVLSYYSSASAENFVDLRKTSFIGSSLDAEQYVLHSSPAINDCIYRNMYRYR